MNAIFLRLVTVDAFNNCLSTDFRPEDREMTPQALGFSGIPNFRQVHGHNATMNETEPGVTNLNARVATGPGREIYTPVSVAIGYAAADSNQTMQSPDQTAQLI